jgi:hypothetical protein
LSAPCSNILSVDATRMILGSLSDLESADAECREKAMRTGMQSDPQRNCGLKAHTTEHGISGSRTSPRNAFSYPVNCRTVTLWRGRGCALSQSTTALSIDGVTDVMVVGELVFETKRRLDTSRGLSSSCLLVFEDDAMGGLRVSM